MSFVTDAIGLTDFEGEEDARKEAARQSDRSYALTREQIEFQKEQYADWKNIYGDIQENLGDYYNELTPDRIVTLGLENQQQEFQAAKKEFQKIMAQRGISPDSNISTVTEGNMGFANATERARIRSTGPQAAAEEKLKFLGVGLGQGTQMLGVIGNAYNSGANNATNLSGANLSLYQKLNANNRNTIGDIVGIGLDQSGFLK